eukprot:scaffold53_cov193-Pinguiococcus_pyrenoidosus.AAC.24
MPIVGHRVLQEVGKKSARSRQEVPTWSQKALEELGGVRVHSRSDVDAVIQYIVVDVKLERISPREAHRGTGVCGAESAKATAKTPETSTTPAKRRKSTCLLVRQGLRRLRQHRTELDSVTCRRRSQDPGHDGTEVSTLCADEAGQRANIFAEGGSSRTPEPMLRKLSPGRSSSSSATRA